MNYFKFSWLFLFVLRIELDTFLKSTTYNFIGRNHAYAQRKVGSI